MHCVICPGCREMVIQDWRSGVGRIVRDPRRCERREIQRYMRTMGWSYEIAGDHPGEVHHCPAIAAFLLCPKVHGETLTVPLDLHLWPIVRGDIVQCVDCLELGLMFADFPVLITPGFAQRETMRRLMTADERQRYKIAVGPWDGTAGPHECGVLAEGCYGYREADCGEGEGRR